MLAHVTGLPGRSATPKRTMTHDPRTHVNLDLGTGRSADAVADRPGIVEQA